MSARARCSHPCCSPPESSYWESISVKRALRTATERPARWSSYWCGYIIRRRWFFWEQNSPGPMRSASARSSRRRWNLPAHAAKATCGRATESVKELGKELSGAQAPGVPPVPGDRASRRNPQNQPGRPLPVQVVEEPANGLKYLRDVVKPFLAPLGMFGVVLIFSIFLL